MSNERNAMPIDDQLLIITAIARAAGYDDGAAWIDPTVGVKQVRPSALPFTAEEARERDLCSDEIERVVATLRSYADILDRDDALERAAEEMLAVLARLYAQPDGTNLIPLLRRKSAFALYSPNAQGR